MSGIVEGLATEAVWTGGTSWLGRVLRRRIRITTPRPLETLTDRQPLGSKVSYAVQGTLRHLPRDHRIWLLTQDEYSGAIWPHGFESVQYDQVNSRWFGRVGDLRRPTVKIIAVVAPPTSQDFFTYYQKHGEKTGYAALTRIPPECRNRDEVQARVP